MTWQCSAIAMESPPIPEQRSQTDSLNRRALWRATGSAVDCSMPRRSNHISVDRVNLDAARFRNSCNDMAARTSASGNWRRRRDCNPSSAPFQSAIRPRISGVSRSSRSTRHSSRSSSVPSGLASPFVEAAVIKLHFFPLADPRGLWKYVQNLRTYLIHQST